MKKGIYGRYVTALGKDGKSRYEYAWLFIIGKPVKQELLDAETKDLTGEVKQDSNGK